MLKQQIERYIHLALGAGEQTVALHDEMKGFAEKHRLIPDNVTVVAKDEAARFSDAYVERCEKGTSALVLVEIPLFLTEPITHLQKHSQEFVHVESESFRLLGINAVSLEFDEKTETYEVKLGFKAKPEADLPLRTYLAEGLVGIEPNYQISFSEEGNLWHIQFPLNGLARFDEEMTLLDAFENIYHFLYAFIETLEAGE